MNKSLGYKLILGAKGIFYLKFAVNNTRANLVCWAFNKLKQKFEPSTSWELDRNSDAFYKRRSGKHFLCLQLRAVDHEADIWKAARMHIPDKFYRTWNDISLSSQFLIGCSWSLRCLYSPKAGSILLPSVSVISSLQVPYGPLIPMSLKPSQVP